MLSYALEIVSLTTIRGAWSLFHSHYLRMMLHTHNSFLSTPSKGLIQLCQLLSSLPYTITTAAVAQLIIARRIKPVGLDLRRILACSGERASDIVGTSNKGKFLCRSPGRQAPWPTHELLEGTVRSHHPTPCKSCP